MTNKIFAGPAGCDPLLVEGKAIDAFLPGTLLTRSAAGLATSTKAATTFGNDFIIAKEQPSTLGGGIAVAAVVGDTAEAIVCRTGEYVYLPFKVANITAKSTAVAANGNGQFKAAALDNSEQVFAYTEQVINVTKAGTLVLCRVA